MSNAVKNMTRANDALTKINEAAQLLRALAKNVDHPDFDTARRRIDEARGRLSAIVIPHGFPEPATKERADAEQNS